MSHLHKLTGSIRAGLLALLAFVLVIGACFGIIYWALRGSLLGVALSAMLPGFGAIWAVAKPAKQQGSGGQPADAES